MPTDALLSNPAGRSPGVTDQPRPVDGLLRLALAHGDERLAIDPDTGRSRYGVPPHSTRGERWFASSTASPISDRGRVAVARALGRAMEGDPGQLTGWPASIRRRLLDLFGIDGTEVVLAGSGTEAELIVLSLAQNLLQRSIANIVVAPSETGSGVMLAAGGRHFLATASRRSSVRAGEALEGMKPVLVTGVDIRDHEGKPLSGELIDRAVLGQTEQALAAGHGALVHCLDASKTGLSGLNRAAAAALCRTAAERVLVVVDACQLRCSAEQIRADLAAGFFVMITGSKFAGGPPFSGAVLVPPRLVARLQRLVVPAGLGAYSTQADWPEALCLRDGNGLDTEINLGLLVRWEAALAEMVRYWALASDLRHAAISAFGTHVERTVAEVPGLGILKRDSVGQPERPATLFPISTRSRCGDPLDAALIHRELGAQGFRVGQPVAVGNRSVLRVSLSASQVTDVADRIKPGCSFEAAFEPLARDVTALFRAWSAIRDRV